MARTKKRKAIRIKDVVKLNAAKYSTPQEMLDKINEYFDIGYGKKTVIVGRASNKRDVEIEVISIIGLSLFLGFKSRTSFFYYANNKPEFRDVIDYGKSLVSMHYEGLLQAGVSPTAMMFMLSNIDGMTATPDVADDDRDAVKKITFINNNLTVNNNSMAIKEKSQKIIDITRSIQKDIPKQIDKKLPEKATLKSVEDLLKF